MRAAENEFVRACRRAFAFLCERHGFDAPEAEQLGHETFVRFHRGARTVSISIEPGARPLVELFHPSDESGEPALPWAARQGVSRARRIPRLAVDVAFVRGDPASLERLLTASASQLEQREARWLAADASD